VELICQGDLFEGEAPEPFGTFVENALSKARFAAEKTGLPAIADDAGLCVDAFGGLPGWTRPTTAPSSATRKAMPTMSRRC
jgi:XTP/dITP diphosphohydrolase